MRPSRRAPHTAGSRSTTWDACAVVGGAATALFVLVGRFSPKHLGWDRSAVQSDGGLLLEPRLWAVIALVMALIVESVISGLREESAAPRATRRDWSGRLTGASLLAFLAYLPLTVLWAPDLDLALYGAYEIALILVVVGAVWRFMSLEGADAFRRAFWGTMLAATLVLGALAFGSVGASSRLAVLGGGPNVFARLMSLLAIGMLTVPRRLPVLPWAVAVLAMGLVVATGSRGGMVAAAAGLGACVLLDRRKVVTKAFVVVAIGILLLMFVSFTSAGQAIADTFVDRVVVLSLQEHYTSSRDVLFREAVDLWLTNPITGCGLKAWSTWSDAAYSHNLAMEVLYQGGLIAFVPFALSMLAFGVHTFRNRRVLHVASVAAAVMFLVACQLSGDLFDSRGLFVLMLISVPPDCSRREANDLTVNTAPDTLDSRREQDALVAASDWVGYYS